MQQEIVISGFGGQGVMFAGQLLAYSAMDEGLHVTWIPSYGPEMRGGTANCTVIFSDEEIGSPLVHHPYAAIVMNQPSLDKYEALIAPNGVLVVNSSLVTRPVERTDITVVNVPANMLAESLGNPKLINIVLVGALIAATQMLSVETVVQALADHMVKKGQVEMLQANRAALRSFAAQPA